MSFNGNIDSVFTLAHEMYHSLHSWYSNHTQPFTYAEYRLFVAEVASTCNEALLIRYLLKHAKEKEEKIFLLNYFLDQFKERCSARRCLRSLRSGFMRRWQRKAR